jgi:DNA-binding NarL/FixJ family response regulator
MWKVASADYEGTIIMNKLRIVVADDHGDMRWAAIRLLSDEFSVVGSAADGRNLIDAAITLIPDVIVSDVRMPLFTGPEAMEVLRATGLNIPFVFVSTDASNVESCIEAGCMGFVHKLDMGHELVRAVSAASRRQIYISREALTIEGLNYASGAVSRFA